MVLSHPFINRCVFPKKASFEAASNNIQTSQALLGLFLKLQGNCQSVLLSGTT
jgi:hypothetical protein